MPKRIEIRGVIIPNDYQWVYDLFDIEATSPSKVFQAMQEANGEDLEVIVNSGGGDVFSGSEIYTSLKEYPADVIVKIVGVAASAASVIAMSGKKIAMSPTAQLMIHNASTITEGDKREHRHSADFLQTIDSTIANAYRLKTGLSQSELLTLMNRETWMNAQDALKNRFIDEIMFDGDDQLRAVASVAAEMIPQKVIEKLRNEFANLKIKPEIPERNDEQVENNQQPTATNTTQNSVNKDPAPTTAPTTSSAVGPTAQAANATPVSPAATVDLAAKERERLKAIDDIASNIDPELVNEAKYGENPMTAEELSFRALKEGKVVNTGLFEQAVQANKDAGTDDVKAQTQPQDSEKEYDLDNLKDLNNIFSHIAASSQMGRPQNIRRG